MRIGIVLHPYGEDKPAGLGRAIFEITRSILETDRKNEYLIILRKKPKIPPQFPGNNWKLKIVNWKFLWLDRALWREDLDVCIFNTPIISFFIRPKKSIVIAYDFAYDDFGPNHFLKLYHRFSLKAADLIISISEATKKEAIRIFKIPKEKIKVVYLGFNNICQIPAASPPRIPEKFFLFVGAIKARKNVLGIVRAFEKIKKEGKLEHKLIISGNGRGKYFEEILNYVRKSGLSGEIVFLGQTSEGELSYLYQNATALLYPSFVEGFGFPILEAMACGLPVITSNTSSLPEIAGEAAIFVDPKNTDEIKNGIINLSSSDKLRKELIKKGKEQIKKFFWNKTASEIIAFIAS